MARCFALERVLYEGGFEQVFAGEITGLISAGAFIAFGAPTAGALLAADYEGMLPVRMLRVPARAQAEQRGASGRRAAQAGRRGEGEGERDWWELNEQGTILRGERTGAALRLGDEVEVRVARVDTARGRVDLCPAG